MNFARVIFRPLYWLAGKVFGLWARPEIRPEAPAELIAGSDAAVIYVLESGGLADLLTDEQSLALLAQWAGVADPEGLPDEARGWTDAADVLALDRGLPEFGRAEVQGRTDPGCGHGHRWLLRFRRCP